MSIINATPLLAAAGGEYQISRSVRLRSSASAYFNRTPASAGNRKTWTWSSWVKRSNIGTTSELLGSNGTTNNTNFAIEFSGDTLYVGLYSVLILQSTAVFRDPSAWYHIVVNLDTTQATASNRCRVYVNGSEITTWSTDSRSSLTQNADYGVNNTDIHNIGRNPVLAARYFDGYLTEINFIDGQALTPSSFGETDAVTGVWKPKKYTGTYGTNGFYLNFSDNSSNTATTIGKDYSGNGNNWTPNNISVTAGVTYDSMLDVPTLYADGGNGRGNYCTLSPLSGGLTPTNGNLTCNQPSAAWVSTASTFTLNSGKWYFEIGQSGLTGAQYSALGLRPVGQVAAGEYAGSVSGSYGCATYSGGLNAYSGGTAGGTISASYTAASVFQCAVDFDAGKVWFGDGSSWIGGGSPASGTSPTYTFTANTSLVPYVSAYANQTHANFGQRPFSYTPPTGFKALNTQNLPEPTIKKGNQYFDATTYTGTGSALTVTNSGSMQPDLVWIKSRSNVTNHNLTDAVRGVDKLLFSNSTAAEATFSGGLSSFNSGGFSLASGGDVGFSASGYTYVGWQWKESPSAGFDIVTYNGTGAAQTVAHNLGVAPRFIIAKRRNAAVNWFVGSGALPSWSYALEGLNTTAAANSGATAVWNATAPTSSVFSVGTDLSASGGTYVAYLFAEVAGYSKFGSYTGNGSADGPFVFCGFRPRFILVKRATTDGAAWNIVDTSRSSFNVSNAALYPNLSNAEASANVAYDILSNGFKVRDGVSGDDNLNGATYIFAAFAESPFKTSLAR